MNPYLNQIYNVLPGLLALYNSNRLSSTFGVGDRYYWGWKLIDFGNGTFQGSVNGLTRLLKGDLLPDLTNRGKIQKLISNIFTGAETLRRRNGSMEEAFPYESSFCVTALVAYDLLTSMELQKEDLSQIELERRLDIICPMIKFLSKTDEHHAFISNHLATAAAALYKWHRITGDKSSEIHGEKFITRIIDNMSDEGWFREYGGADPGYQTLCMHYLIDLDCIRRDLGLNQVLLKAVRFLTHFVHPDGSFGGLYGSRSTRIYYPTFAEYLFNDSEEARLLAICMRQSIHDFKTVTLQAIDGPNLVPLFNSYAWAATLFERNKFNIHNEPQSALPAFKIQDQKIDFPEAGICIRGTKKHYTIINLVKGGVVASYSRDGSNRFIDGGCIFNYKKRWFSTQADNLAIKVKEAEQSIILEVKPTEIINEYPKPWQFIILRLLNISLMKSILIGNVLKKMLVKKLITKNKQINFPIRRIIYLHDQMATIQCAWVANSPEESTKISPGGEFMSFHMASAGYWQRGDN